MPLDNPNRAMSAMWTCARGAVTELVCEIERALGVELRFPEIGGGYGLAVEGRLVPLEMPEQVYAALRLSDAIRLRLGEQAERAARIVEIGAGYGGVCYWLLRRGQRVARYTIVDLPTVNVLQGYFLAQALGANAVSFFGEARAQVTVLPAGALAEVEVPCDVVFNKDSMPEMPEAAICAYLEWIGRNCGGFFFSYGHEAQARFGVRSRKRVHRGCPIDGLHRVGRERSWLRRGYVQEIYVGDGRSASRST